MQKEGTRIKISIRQYAPSSRVSQVVIVCNDENNLGRANCWWCSLTRRIKSTIRGDFESFKNWAAVEHLLRKLRSVVDWQKKSLLRLSSSPLWRPSLVFPLRASLSAIEIRSRRICRTAFAPLRRSPSKSRIQTPIFLRTYPLYMYIQFNLFIWRRERDSNPRYGLTYTHFPGVLLQPLGHLSSIFQSHHRYKRDNRKARKIKPVKT